MHQSGKPYKYEQRRNTASGRPAAHLPMQSGSEMKASLLFGPTSMHNFPSRTTGQDFLHSWLHFFGLHLDVLMMAIRVMWSSSAPLPVGLPPFFFGGIVVDVEYQWYDYKYRGGSKGCGHRLSRPAFDVVMKI